MPEYSNVPEIAYDWIIVVCFFLGGLSAGSFLFSTFATYRSEELRPMGRPVAVLVPIILGVAMIMLLLHLGQPFLVWRLFVWLNPVSAISWGVWVLLILFVVSVLYAWNLIKSGADKAKKFGYIGTPFAVLAAVYTGVLLTQSPGRPLWHTALVPVLFITGALISGTALALLTSVGRQDSALLTKVGRFLGLLLIVEFVMLIVEIFVLLKGGGEGAAAAMSMVAGPYAVAFLGVEVLLGMIIPVILLYRSKAPAAQAIASILVLIGIFTMRYVVVVGGQVIQ